MIGRVEYVARFIAARHYAACYGLAIDSARVMSEVERGWRMHEDDALAAIEAIDGYGSTTD